jgi:type IV fimbrial biogenesis protein FimT
VLNKFIKSRSCGFSLIELMIGVVIMGLLLAFAAPNLRAWILNAQISNAAESIQNGLQLARAQAVARNSDAKFTLRPVATDDSTSWDVDVINLAPLPLTHIETRLSNEGSTSVLRTVLPVGTTTVTFDNTGLVKTINADGSAPFTSVNLYLANGTLAVGQMKDLNVIVGFDGSVKMCDPHVMPPNPRAC